MSSFWPQAGNGSLPTVADSTARLAITGSPDGYAVIQLDNSGIYVYSSGTAEWNLVGGSGTFVDKTGDTMSGNLLFTNGEGIDSAVGGTPVLNIGVTNASTINIGSSGTVVNILGTTNTNNVVNYSVSDKLITINDGGSAASATGAGLEVEENSVITGYIKTASDRNGWDFLAPNQTGVFKTIHGGQNLTLDFSGLSSSAKTYTALNASGVVALTSAALTAGSVVFTGADGVLTQSNSDFFWDNTNKYLGLGTATPAAKLHLSGGITAASWTTNGIGIRVAPATYTNSSSSGTVATQVAHVLGTPTFAFSSATTITDAATFYIEAQPTAGTNATLTRPWALYAPSGKSYINELNVGSKTQVTTVGIYATKNGTNAAAAGGYFLSNMSITSAGSYQNAGLTGDTTCSGTANNTSSDGVIGVDSISRSTNTATVSFLVGIRGVTINSSTGTVTNAICFRARTATNTGGGAVTNTYGFYVDDQTVGTNNYGAYFNVSSGSNKWNIYGNGSATNYLNGSLTIGTTAAAAKLQVLSTTEQLRLNYDASNYVSYTVSSAGLLTVAATGSSAGVSFSSRVMLASAPPASAAASGTAGHLTWDNDYVYVCTATNTWKRVAIATW